MMTRKLTICLFFGLFLAMIPAANYSLLHLGTSCLLNEPCVIPVWLYPVIYAPSGVMFAGLAFVLRDILQRMAGLSISLIAVVCGTILSYLYIDERLATAGSIAYFLSEITDTCVYSYLQKYNLIMAIFVSACTGLVIDSVVFLHLAFHSYQFLTGQIIGKLWMVILSIPIIQLSRKMIN
jgi:uncharacterized PurR-regulated membrane protein YhhQ (DUF165 family)